MPRSGGGVYSLPAGLPVNGEISNATDDVRTPFSDIEADLNTPRPVVAGGTGASSASAARTNLGLGDLATFDAADFFKDQTTWNTGTNTGQAFISPDQLTQRIAAALAGFSVVPAGAVMPFAMNTAPSGWLKANGANVSRVTYPDLFAALCPVLGTVTVTIASPGVFTLNAHGLVNGDQVRLTTTGALPTGLNTSTTYFVVSSATNTFQLSLTLGGAAINTSGSQSGVHSVQYFPFGAGDGSTTFGLPDMRAEFARGWDDGRGVDAGRVLGSAQSDELESHSHRAHSGGISTVTADTGTLNGSRGFAGGYNTPVAYVTTASGGQAFIEATGGTETRPRNVSMLYCIKT